MINTLLYQTAATPDADAGHWLPVSAKLIRSFTKPSLTFIHGWGMNVAVFMPLFAQLAEQYECIAIELPGHGQVPLVNPTNLKEVGLPEADQPGFAQTSFYHTVRAIVHDLRILPPGPVIGWSMGGLFATVLAANHPDLFNRLILITSTPHFLQSDNWPVGMPHTRAQRFTQDMLKNPADSILRFLNLQFFQEPAARQLARSVYDLVATRGLPSRAGLQLGMDWLSMVDTRAELKQLSQLKVPLLACYGLKDNLINHKTAELVQALYPGAKIQIDRTAHLPFISDSQQFATRLDQFVQFG